MKGLAKMRAKYMLSLSTCTTLFLFMIFIQCSGQIPDERSATVTDANGTSDRPVIGITFNNTDSEDNNENRTDRIDNNNNDSKIAVLDHPITDGHADRSFDRQEPYLPLGLAVPSTESLADLTTEGTAFFAGSDTVTDTSTMPTADNTWNASDQVPTRLLAPKANSSGTQSEADGRDDQTFFPQNKSLGSLSIIPSENQDVIVQFLATAASAAASKRLPSEIGLGHQTALHPRHDSKKMSESASESNKDFQLDSSTHELTPTADILKYLDKKLILRHHDPTIPISQEKLILRMMNDNKYLLYKPMLKKKHKSESKAADKPELEKVQEFESTTTDPVTEPDSSSFAAEYQTVQRTALLEDQPTPLEKAPDLGQFSPFEAVRLEANLPVPAFTGFQSSSPSTQPSYARPQFPSRSIRPNLLDQGSEESVRLSPLYDRAREGHPVIQPNRFSQALTDDNSLNFVSQQIPNQQTVDRTFPLWTDPKDISNSREPVPVFPLWVDTVRSPQTNTWNNNHVGRGSLLFPSRTSQQPQYQVEGTDNTGEFGPNYNNINPYDGRHSQNTVTLTTSPTDRQRNNAQQIPPQIRQRRLYNLLPLRQETVQTVEYPDNVFRDLQPDTQYPPYTFDNQIHMTLTPFPTTVDSLRDLFPFPNRTSNNTQPLTNRPTFDPESLPTHNVRPVRQLFQYGIPAVDQGLLPFAADANSIADLLPFSTWPNIIQTSPSLYESTQIVDDTRDTLSPWDLNTSREPCRRIQRYDTQIDDSMADFFPIYDEQYGNLVDGGAIPLLNQFIYDGLPSPHFLRPGGATVGIQPPLTPPSLYGYLQYLSNTQVNTRPSDTSRDLPTYGQFFRTPLTPSQTNSNSYNAPVSLDEVGYVPSLQRYQYHPNPTTYSASVAARTELPTSSKNVGNRYSLSSKTRNERKQWYDLVNNKELTSNQRHNSDKSFQKQNTFLHKNEHKGIESDLPARRFHLDSVDTVSDKRSLEMAHVTTDVEWQDTAAKTSTHEGMRFIQDQLFPYEPENNRHTETPDHRIPRILFPYEPDRHFETESETTKSPYNQGQRPLFPYEPENNLDKGSEALQSSHDEEPLFPYQPGNYHNTLSDTTKSPDTKQQRPLFPYEPEHNWDRNTETTISFSGQRQRPLFPYEPENNRDRDRVTSHSLDRRPLYPYEPENNRNKLEQGQPDGGKQGHSGGYRDRYLNNQVAIQLYPYEPENNRNKKIHSAVGPEITTSHSNQRPLFPYEPKHRQTPTPTPPTHHSQIALFPYEPENNQDRPFVSSLQNPHQQLSYADRFLKTAVSQSHQERRPLLPYEPETNKWNGKLESKVSQRYAQRTLFPYEPENYRDDEIQSQGGPTNHNANMPDGRQNQRPLFPYEPENNLGIRQLYHNPLFPYEPENNGPRITSSTSQNSPGSYIDHYLKTTESFQNQRERSLFPYESESSYGKRIDSISPGLNENKKSLFPYQPGHSTNGNNNVFLDNTGFQQEYQRPLYPYEPKNKLYENDKANQRHSPQSDTPTLFPYEPPNNARLMGTGSPPQDHGPRPPFPYEPRDNWGGAEAAHSQLQHDQGSYRDRYLKETRTSTEHQAQRSLFPYEPESNLNPTTHVQLSTKQQLPNHRPVLFPYESENNRGEIQNFQQNEAKENYQPQLFPYEPENHRRTATEPGSHGQSQKLRQLFPYEPENNPERYGKWQGNAEDLNQRPLFPYEPEDNEDRNSAPTNRQHEREPIFPYEPENNHETNAEHGGQQRPLFPYEPENNPYRNERFDARHGEMSTRQWDGDLNKRDIFPYEKDDHKPSPYSAIRRPSIDSYSGARIVNTLLSNGHKIKNDFGIPASIFSSHAASADHPPRKESESRLVKRLEDLIKRPFDLTELLSYNGVPLIKNLHGEKGFRGSQDSGKYSHTSVQATPWEPPIIAPRIGNIRLTSDLYDVIESQRHMLGQETLMKSADSPLQRKTPEDKGDSVLRKSLEDTHMDKEHAAIDKLSLLKNFMPVNNYDTNDHADSVSTYHSRETKEKDNGKAIKKPKEHKITDVRSSIKSIAQDIEELYEEDGQGETQTSSTKSREKIMKSKKDDEKTTGQKSSSQVLPWGFIRPQPDPDYRPHSFSGNGAWSDPNFHSSPWQLVRAPVMSNLSPIRTQHIATSTADQTTNADNNDDSNKSHANLQEQEEDAIAAKDSQISQSEPQVGHEDSPSDASSKPNFDQQKDEILDNNSAMQHPGSKIKQKLEAVQMSPDKGDLDRNVTFLRDNNRANSDQNSKINETNKTDVVLTSYTNHLDNESKTTDMNNNNSYDQNDNKHDNSNGSNNSDINSNRTSQNLADISSESNNNAGKDVNVTSEEFTHTDIQEPPALPHDITPSPTPNNQLNSVDKNLLFHTPPDADVLNNLPHPSNNQINSPTISDNLPPSLKESDANLPQDSMHIDDHQSSGENQPSRANFDAPASSNVLDGVNTESDEYSPWLTSGTQSGENGQRLQRSARDVDWLDPPPNSVAQLSRDSDRAGGQDYTVHAWNHPLGGKTWLRDFTNSDELSSSTSESDVNREAGQDSQVLTYADRFLLDKKLKAARSTTNQNTVIRRSTITRSNFTPTQNGNDVIPSLREQTPVNPYGQSVLTPKGYYDPQTGGYFVDQVADTSQISTTDSRLPSFDSHSQFYSSYRAEERDIPNSNIDRDDFRPPTNSGPPDFGVLTNNNSRYLNNRHDVEQSNVKSSNTNAEITDSSNDFRSSDRQSPDYVIINSQNTESPETTNMKLVYNTDQRNYNSKQGGRTSTQGGYSSNQGGYSSNLGGYTSNQDYSSTQGDYTHFSNQGYNQGSYTSSQGQEPFRTKTLQSNTVPYSGVKQTNTPPSYRPNSQYSPTNSVQSYRVPQSQYNTPQTKNDQSQVYPNVPFSPVGYLSYYFASPYAYVTDPRLVSNGFQQQIDRPQYVHGGSGTINSRSSPQLKTTSYYMLQNGVQKGVYSPWYNSANNNRFSNSAKFTNRINLDEDARDMQAILEYIYAKGKFDSKNPGNHGSDYGYSGYKKGYSYPMKYGNSLGHVAYGYNHGSNFGNIYQGYNNRHNTGYYGGIRNGYQTGSNRLIVSQNRNFFKNQRKTYGDFSRNYNPVYFKNTKLSRLPSVNRGNMGVNPGLARFPPARSGYDRDMQAIEHFVYSHPKFGKGQSSKGFGGLF